MNRVDFLTTKVEKRTKIYEPINNGNIQIFINDKHAKYVKSMKLNADLSFGFIRASVTIIRRGDLQTEEINKDMSDGLILEKISNEKGFTNFYLRTII